MQGVKKIRPYWHVDMKWIFGILLFLALLVSTVLFATSTLLSPKVALPGATYVVANQFSKNGLDDATDINKYKKQLEKSNKTEFKPIEGMDVTITKDELLNQSPREIRLNLFQQIVEPIYYGTAELDKNAAEQYGALTYLNEETYKTLMLYFWISLIPVALFTAGIVFFSHRYGRLVSPAVLLLTFGTLPSLSLILVQTTTPPKGDERLFSFLPQDIVLEAASTLSIYFYTLFYIGIALVTSILVIKLVRKFAVKLPRKK